MKSYQAKDIRNVAIVGHNSIGKTLLAESMAFNAGAITRMGSIDEGTTASDYTPEEIEKKYSIRSSLLQFEHKNKKLNVIDAPGYADFIGETYGAINIAEAVVVTVSAASTQGVEVGTEKGVEISQKLNKPFVFFINKCDYENANFDKVIEDLKGDFSSSVTELQFPVGKGDNFEGIVDVVEMKMFTAENGKQVAKDIPASVKDKAESIRENLVENIAGSDEELMDIYLEEGDLTPEQFNTGFKKAFLSGMILPLFCGSAMKGVGVTELLDNIINIFPSPADSKAIVVEGEGEEKEEKEIEYDATKPLSAFVFKVASEQHVGELYFLKLITGKISSAIDLYNNGNAEKVNNITFGFGKQRIDAAEAVAGDIISTVKLKSTKINDTLKEKSVPFEVKKVEYPNFLIWEALKPKDKKDEAKIGQALTALSNEDPTFIYKYDPELKQTIARGQGVKHLEIILQRLNDRHGIEVDTIEPKIPYRETITKEVEGSYRHKKQSGGKGQFGEVHFRMRPRPRGEGFNFVDAITQGSIPARFIPAVEKGILETLPNGVISGSQVVDIEVELFFGKFHDVDSSEMAFKIASWNCFKQLFKEAKPILLEPIYLVKVKCPVEYTGDVMGDISSKRGRPEGMEDKGGKQEITAKVPLSELYGYATTLRSMTQGKASFDITFSHYELVPHEVQEKIVQKYEETKGQEEE